MFTILPRTLLKHSYEYQCTNDSPAEVWSTDRLLLFQEVNDERCGTSNVTLDMCPSPFPYHYGVFSLGTFPIYSSPYLLLNDEVFVSDLVFHPDGLVPTSSTLSGSLVQKKLKERI